ncbi:unnamed protein product [Dicrocoelium dendriticum]|nr:unnamed protein product [Dicrocoelium dendriticum]
MAGQHILVHAMEPGISAEEFQRYQLQLLDLREAQLEAREYRLRTELRIKHLEEELLAARRQTESFQSGASRLEEVQKENNGLREKLRNTESSFQLQSSTLRAECHRLSAELNRLHLLLNKPSCCQSCQTVPCPTIESPVQTDEPLDAVQLEPTSSEEVAELRVALDTARVTQSFSDVAISTLETRLTALEKMVYSELIKLQERISQLAHERDALSLRTKHYEQSLRSARETESDLRGQLEVVKHRSDKLNQELRRHLSRLIRTQPNDTEQLSLCKSSTYSSSSSLSSNLVAGLNATAVNGEVSSVSASSLPGPTVDRKIGDIPSGYFPMADFKAVVDRMSEVQDENCMLRLKVDRLQVELTSKSKALYTELERRLHDPAPPNHVSELAQASPYSTSLSSNTSARSSLSSQTNAGQSTFSWFSLLKPTSAALSSVNVNTVNRLKQMCSDLLTQNIRLSEELESLRCQR